MKQRTYNLTSFFAVLALIGLPAMAQQYPVVDTGQTTCYDSSGEIVCPVAGESFYGQDAQHTGNAPSFTDNGDGTVTDLVTGLMWQQSPDTDGDGDIDAADKLSYDEAVAYPGTLNAQSFGGYTDWRLPTIKEAYSLIDFSGVDPSGYEGDDTSGLIPFIDTDFFGFAYGDTDGGERIIDSQYASSNLYVGNTSMLFGVNFADGRIKGYGLTLFGSDKTFFTICVRGATSYGVNEFVDNGDGTVTDDATGLMWSQDDNGEGLNWEEALAWVEERNAGDYLGYDDWRLPDVKELQSILDYTRSPDTTGSAAIDSIFSATSITNEAGQTDYPFYWSGTTHSNWSDSAGSAAAYVSFGRAMGYMDSTWQDVHGAGAQRSDPKEGDPEDWPTGNGPQGDAIRIYNFVRPVRDAESSGAGDSTQTYWLEIVANLGGVGDSQWRTDLVARNSSAADAEITMVLHTEDGDSEIFGTISGSTQAIYENVVDLFGVTGKGTFEIRSDRPLTATARVYNQTDDGTYGGSFDAKTEDDGLATGEGAWLFGLRQLDGAYRTNLSVTNTGSEAATVGIALYRTDNTLLDSYTLTVEPAEVVQDLQPFANRAGQASLGWGFARVNVESGSGILSSASVIDSRTGDSTMVAMKR